MCCKYFIKSDNGLLLSHDKQMKDDIITVKPDWCMI